MSGVVETIVLSSCHLLGWVWNVLSFVPWYYLSGNYKKNKFGKVQAVSTNGPAGPYRAVTNIEKLCEGFNGARTLDVLFKTAVDKFGDAPMMGTRELISEEDETQPNGRVFKKNIMGDYNWLTYKEVHERVSWLASGIQAMGAGDRERVIIFADTKAEWMISAQACFMRGFPLVTIYSTLGDDGLTHGFNETRARFVCTDAALLPKLLKLIGDLKHIETIIYFGDAKPAMRDEFPTRVRLFSFKQVLEYGAKLKNLNAPINAPHAEDVSVIMYTSGSTGVPKGVMISHFNIAAAIGAVPSVMEPNMGPSDTFIGYLPLAHIMEIMCEMICIVSGAKIGYSSALTLSDQSSKIKRGSKGDVSVLNPTVMVAVPMIMDRIRKTVFDKVTKGPFLLQLLFKFAYSYKLNMVRKGYDTPILNSLIFKKLRMILGGEVRSIISGGAPLSTDTEEFMNICFCCPILQGYGLTETAASCTIGQPWDQSTGRVGCPLPCSEVMLESWEEGGYTVNDKPFPRGEILIGGNTVSMGYLDQPEKTAEAYIRHDDGKIWFHSGDIGEIHSDGAVKIVDRKKDLVKLAHGEYVSLGKVEAAMKTSNFVENCCIYGKSSEMYVVALVLPNPVALEALARELGVVDTPLSVLVNNSDVFNTIKKSVDEAAKAAGLNKTEVPAKIHLVADEWTPENEMVTAAMKLKRVNINNKYRDVLNQLYTN